MSFVCMQASESTLPPAPRGDTKMLTERIVIRILLWRIDRLLPANSVCIGLT